MSDRNDGGRRGGRDNYEQHGRRGGRGNSYGRGGPGNYDQYGGRGNYVQDGAGGRGNIGGRSNYAQEGGRGRGNFGGRGNYEQYGGGGRSNYVQEGGRGHGNFGGRGNYEQYGGGGRINYAQDGARGRGNFGGRGNYAQEGGRGFQQHGRGRHGEGSHRGRGGYFNHHQSASPDHSVAKSSSSAPAINFGPSWTPDGKLEAGQSSLRSWLPDGNHNIKLSPPPPRPGRGTRGSRCTVIANHFRVNLDNWEKELYHYDVKISRETTDPKTLEVASSQDRRLIICELAKLKGASCLDELTLAYDGGKNVYTAGSLPFSAKSFEIEWSDREKTGEDKKYTVDISFVRTYHLEALKQFTEGKVINTPQELIQVLDVALLVSHSLKHVRIGRSFFSQEFDECRYLGNGLKSWSGFHQSIRPTQMGLSLNLNISATPFYEPGPVRDYITKALGLNNIDTSILNENDRFKLQKALNGVRVVTTHTAHKRTYKITGITSLPMSKLKFEGKDEQELSVVQYFRETYHRTLQYLSWPCLVSAKSNRSIYLPIEVCEIDARQRYAKNLNDGQKTKLLNSTNKTPDDRKDTILKMVQKNNYGNDEYARAFGIDVIESATSIEARKLPVPELQFGTNKTHNWRNKKKMYTAEKVEYWACIDFSNAEEFRVDDFCGRVAGTCVEYGMEFPKTPLIKLYKAKENKVAEELRLVYENCTTALEASSHNSNEQLQLLFVILPDDNSFYGEIKRICETELGIVSQCCLKSKILKSNHHYLVNLVLKINVKVGGRNMVLKDAIDCKIPLITETNGVPTIFFGADVTHPLAGEDSSFSIAAVAASMDWPEVTTYRAMVSAQKQRQEIIADLFKSTDDGIIKESLLAFNKKTNRKPGRIIFYRDGVGDGQLGEVREREIDAIIKACESLEEGYRPSITFIVVKKRHHTRLFPVEDGQRDNSGNILAGTVVDRMICHPREFDFYLCSHSGIKGTSRPTLYHVLLDENGFTADGLQLLTHHLCYTFARCTQSISIVPAVQYAHLAAYRARFYCKGGAGDRNFKVQDYVKNVMYFC